MTPHPDEQARELAVGIGGHVLDSWQRQRVIREVKLALAQVRLAEAEWWAKEHCCVAANGRSCKKRLASLRQVAGEETKP